MKPLPLTWEQDELQIAPGLDASSIRADFLRKLFFEQAKFPGVATRNDHYLALAYTVRDRVLHRWVRSARAYLEGRHRTVLYLSAEYLIGPQLGLNLMDLDIEQETRRALESLGLDLDELLEQEEEPGLGNGGLGRLAACFMESLAGQHLPAIGYGIRYEYGIFDQEIRGGWQLERADRWLRLGNPWEIHRYEIEYPVGFGGFTERVPDGSGGWRVCWNPERVVLGIPYDTPMLGPGHSNANFLRLWGAVAPEEFDLAAFQAGDYRRAADAKVRSENIAKILYPNDMTAAGKQLRLEQQLFFVSCSLQDAIRLLLQNGGIRDFADKFSIQLNDTHPSLAVPELMRLLVDQHRLGWDEAWAITTRALSYTNHTLLPEALETWSLPLFAKLLPRHLEIVYEINQRFLDQVQARFPGDLARLQRCSIIDEAREKHVRMAHLASVASHTINGVSELHSGLLRETVLKDFAELWPERFTNVTNGVSFGRFLGLSNPRLCALLREALGERCLTEPGGLEGLRRYAGDVAFGQRWRDIKLANKRDLARWLARRQDSSIDASALLDVQCKRIHEYKRQHLNVLHVIWLLHRIQQGQPAELTPRTVLFAGKAAPDYLLAKLIVRLIHAVAARVSAEPRARELLRVVFVPDFNVQNAQRLYPAADLSEQISTAGHEASGTGNMKLALNGALTIGTLDGANIEIRDAVGPENFFLFGMTAAQVRERRAGYDPRALLARDPELEALVQDVGSGRFHPEEPGLFAPLVRSLVERDPFFVLADFRDYIACQSRVARAFEDPTGWTSASILNTAAMSRFSSDRAVREYASRIWHVQPVDVA